jgi:LysM repeat protein
MDRRQLLFVVLLNSLISLMIALVVVWLADARRPDLEELAARYTPAPPVVLIATPTPEILAEQPPTPTPPPPEAVEPTPPPAPVDEEPEIYVVQTGDSLFGIAIRYNLTVPQLMEANNLTNPDFVYVGQRLVIPQRGNLGATSGNNATNPNNPGSNNPNSGVTLRVEGPGDLADERVLIVNESNNALSLQGWTLGRVNGPIYSFGNLALFPGSSVRLHSGSGPNDSLNLYWARSSPVWESGAVARLFNAEGREVASYTIP